MFSIFFNFLLIWPAFFKLIIVNNLSSLILTLFVCAYVRSSGKQRKKSECCYVGGERARSLLSSLGRTTFFRKRCVMQCSAVQCNYYCFFKLLSNMIEKTNVMIYLISFKLSPLSFFLLRHYLISINIHSSSLFSYFQFYFVLQEIQELIEKEL